MIFSPLSVAHATNYITTDLFAHFNFLAVAALLLPSELFIGLARKELFLIDNRKNLVEAPDWSEYWEIKEKSIKNFLKKAGYTTQKVLSPPLRKDDNAIYYCPVCQTEYIGEVEYCSDCGIKLNRF